MRDSLSLDLAIRMGLKECITLRTQDHSAKIKPLPGFEWVQVQTPAVEVNSCLEVLGVAEAPRCLLHPLYGRVHGFEARIGDPMAMVRQDVGQMAQDQPGHLR